jgi:hypothetical protein
MATSASAFAGDDVNPEKEIGAVATNFGATTDEIFETDSFRGIREV